MTPEQKLKHLILVTAINSGYITIDVPITADNVDELFDDDHYDDITDILYDLREGEVDTDVPSEHSRHLESRSVAAKTPDGSWVGWTYWYGGGKHAEPEAIDWMGSAYNLSCIEEEKLVIIQTFTKIEE